MFISMAQLNLDAAELLSSAKLRNKNLPKISKKVQTLETQSDAAFQKLREDADRTFITPIDRQDIYALGKNLNSILDHIENVTTSLHLFKLTSNGDQLRDYASLVEEASDEIVATLQLLSHQGKYVEKIKVKLKTIYDLEKQGDEMMRKSYTKLFTTRKNSTSVIAWKHIYDNLEAVLDECEDTADTISDIILKNY